MGIRTPPAGDRSPPGGDPRGPATQAILPRDAEGIAPPAMAKSPSFRATKGESGRVVQEPSSGVRRLTDLRSPCGSEATLQNLLETAAAKLQACGRLAVLEYEARVEGHDTAATAFRDLAVTEHTACRELLRHLHRHLDETLDLDLDNGSSAHPERDAR